jgi:hypothetical protein
MLGLHSEISTDEKDCIMIEQEIECFEKELKILSKAEKSLDR